MRLAQERSECDIHGARKGYLAHGKACLKVVLAIQSVPKVIEIWIKSIYTIADPILSMKSTFSCKKVVKITCRSLFTAFYECFSPNFRIFLKIFLLLLGVTVRILNLRKKNQLFYKTYLVLFNQSIP